MRIGIAALVLSYVLSQFYRAFLAVLSPILAADLGANPQDLAQASGWWFLTFALMQIPGGWALDRIGPRLTTSVLMVVGAAGAASFAMATSPFGITLAMALIGVGCSTILMASYYIFARSYSPAVFGTLAGMVLGIGNLGNIAASLPLSWAVASFGWRASVWALAAITLTAAVAIFALVRDPARAEGQSNGSFLDLLRMPALWPILIMMAACYTPAAGIRGLWVGPWFTDVFGADAARIGQITLIMGLAMVAGNFAYGPMDRILGTRKWLIFGGNVLMLACLLGLARSAGTPGLLPIVLLAGVGFFGATFPMVIAHGRAFMPPHLVGRGVSLMNLFSIGTVGLMQLFTGKLHAALSPSEALANSAPPATPYAGLFLFYAGLTALGLLAYLFAKDRTD